MQSVDIEKSESGCVITRSFTCEPIETFQLAYQCEPDWNFLLRVEDYQFYWMNLKTNQIVGYIEGDIITYQAVDNAMLWIEAALIRLFAEDQ